MNTDERVGVILQEVLAGFGADPIAARELLAIAGAQAESELRAAADIAQALGETFDLSKFDARRAEAVTRGRERAEEAGAVYLGAREGEAS